MTELDEDVVEMLKRSAEQQGELQPVIKDQHGNLLAGRHRKAAKPDWRETTIMVTDELDRLLKIIHFNVQRRPSQDETAARLLEIAKILEGKGILKSDIGHNLAQMVPYSASYIYRLLPDEYKRKYEAKPQIGTTAELPIETQDEIKPLPELPVSRLVECECCGMGTREPKAFGKYNKLCPSCYLKAVKYPRLFAKEPAARPKPEVKVYKETTEFRRALMQPSRSKFEDKFDEAAAKAGLPYGESNKDICVLKSNVDKYYKCPKGNLIVEFKGPVHKGREDRDDRRRELLLKRRNTEILEIDYARPSDQAVEDAVVAVRGKLVELGGIKV